MGLFSHHGSSTSTNHSTTWNAGTIEGLVNSFNPDIDYIDEVIMQLNPSMQGILNYYESGSGLQNAKTIMGRGGDVMSQATSDFRKLRGLSGEDLLNAFTGATGKLFGEATDFMNQEFQAIEDNAAMTAAQTNAQNAMTNNAGGAVAGSSAAATQGLNTSAQMQADIEENEGKLAYSILKSSASIASSGLKGVLRSSENIIDQEFKAGADLYGVGGKLYESAMSNAWNASLIEQYNIQKTQDVDRKNEMIRGNLEMLEEYLDIAIQLQAAGVDTTSTTTTKY